MDNVTRKERFLAFTCIHLTAACIESSSTHLLLVSLEHRTFHQPTHHYPHFQKKKFHPKHDSTNQKNGKNSPAKGVEKHPPSTGERFLQVRAL